MLNTLREDFPGQMYLARYLSGVAAPIITGDKGKLVGSATTACYIVAWAEGVGNYSLSLGIKQSFRT